ncbi:MAG: hypothetical protein GY711_11540 [bacterium]|nr:hypothetical protein [bacterium]
MIQRQHNRFDGMLSRLGLPALALSALAAGAHALQDPVPDPTTTPVAPAAEPVARPGAADAEGLRTRIRDMRMNLLLGGDKVREAEHQAIGFYNDKASIVENRLDSIEVEASEKRASYDVALTRALEADNLDRKRQATGEASQLRAELTTLDQERAALENRREGLSKMVAAVEARDRDRDRLVAQLETNSDFEHELGMPLFSIGLAPVAEPVPASSPFEDSALIEDLLQRDPRAARALLFDLDPEQYWLRFPLQPPQALLRETLAFPLPDLPGNR